MVRNDPYIQHMFVWLHQHVVSLRQLLFSFTSTVRHKQEDNHVEFYSFYLRNQHISNYLIYMNITLKAKSPVTKEIEPFYPYKHKRNVCCSKYKCKL